MGNTAHGCELIPLSHCVILYKALNPPFGPKASRFTRFQDNPTSQMCTLILWTAHPISHWKQKGKPTCLSKFHFGRALSSTAPHELQLLPQMQRGRAETPQKSQSRLGAQLQLSSRCAPAESDWLQTEENKEGGIGKGNFFCWVL